MLSPYLRRDIEYIPHIGIGLFVRKGAGYDALNPRKLDFDSELYSRALREAKSLKISCFDTVDRLFLDKVILKADSVKTVSSQEFKL